MSESMMVDLKVLAIAVGGALFVWLFVMAFFAKSPEDDQ